METDKPATKILKILLKEFAVKPTITLLAKQISMSRVGAWKVLKKLEKEKLVVLAQIGAGKTSAYSVSLNWDNPLVEKKLSLALTEEALHHQRWLINFAELGCKADFLIIYGSIIHAPKDANDIDILSIAAKSKFQGIDETYRKTQKTQAKQIHTLNFTPSEFRQELEKPNKAFVDALKKGIVLFGQDKFIKFIRGVARR